MTGTVRGRSSLRRRTGDVNDGATLADAIHAAKAAAGEGAKVIYLSHRDASLIKRASANWQRIKNYSGVRSLRRYR